MRLDKEQLTMLVVAIVVVGGAGAAIWMPARQQRQALQQRIDRAQQKLEKARQSPSLSKWHQSVASLEQRLANSRQRVPSQEELAKVLRGLSDVLAKRGVTEQEVSTAPAERFGSFGVTPVTVKFTGSCPDAHAVVKRIEQMPRLIQVDRLEVNHPEPKQPGAVRVYLELSAFFKRKQAESR